MEQQKILWTTNPMPQPDKISPPYDVSENIENFHVKSRQIKSSGNFAELVWHL